MGQFSFMISKYIFVIDHLTLVPFNMSFYIFSQLFLLKCFLNKLCRSLFGHLI